MHVFCRSQTSPALPSIGCKMLLPDSRALAPHVPWHLDQERRALVASDGCPALGPVLIENSCDSTEPRLCVLLTCPGLRGSAHAARSHRHPLKDLQVLGCFRMRCRSKAPHLPALLAPRRLQDLKMQFGSGLGAPCSALLCSALLSILRRTVLDLMQISSESTVPCKTGRFVCGFLPCLRPP